MVLSSKTEPANLYSFALEINQNLPVHSGDEQGKKEVGRWLDHHPQQVGHP
jgi:hypothetical protein